MVFYLKMPILVEVQQFQNSNRYLPQSHSVPHIEWRTGMDWACFWASLPDQAEKKILEIKDFIKDFTWNPDKEITFTKYIFPIECLFKFFTPKIQPLTCFENWSSERATVVREGVIFLMCVSPKQKTILRFYFLFWDNKNSLFFSHNKQQTIWSKQS